MQTRNDIAENETVEMRSFSESEIQKLKDMGRGQESLLQLGWCPCLMTRPCRPKCLRLSSAVEANHWSLAAMHFFFFWSTLNRATNRIERLNLCHSWCRLQREWDLDYEDFPNTKTPWKIIHKACISGKSHRFLIIWPCLWGHGWCIGGLHAIGLFPVEDPAITTGCLWLWGKQWKSSTEKSCLG